VVAIPSEHGGWGLTFEPVLLGLLVEPSWPGVAIGAAALTAFLVRTPLKFSIAAVVADWRVVAGAIVIAGVAALQLVWSRRPVPPAKTLGLTQLAVGLCVVAATAAGVLAWT
jgi:hypothetical protein